VQGHNLTLLLYVLQLRLVSGCWRFLVHGTCKRER